MMTTTLTRSGGLFRGNRVDAVYSHVSDAMYQHNCYIEALPPPLDPEAATNHMKRLPSYSEHERSLSPMQRLMAVQRIVNCIIPLPEYIMIEQKFSRMIYNGYFARNPLASEWKAQMRSAFQNLEWRRGDYDHVPLIRSTSAGFTIFGASGVGKSTMIESILSLYPQVIVHTSYNGTPFDQQQLVWLKLDCPFNASPLGLCTAFFQGIDLILGTNYTTKYKRCTTDFVMPAMAKLAGELGLGVLVIDEIQRLKKSHSGGAENILNFFVQLTNTIGVPVVIIGTYKGYSLFTQEFAGARRAAGQGDVILHNFAPDDFWEDFIETLWKYQWTNVKTPLSATLRRVMYEQSQGITDIAVKIYILMQWQLIGTDDERITEDLIRVVVKENFHVVGPMLQALRNNDIDALEKIEDMHLPANLLDAALVKATSRVLLTGKAATLRNEMLAEKSSHEVGSLPHEQLTLQLVRAGFYPETAIKCARMACDRVAHDTDMDRARLEALRLAVEEESQSEAVASEEKKTVSSRKKAKVVSLSGDLREIIKKAPTGMTPYQELKEAGVIKSPMEFFRGE